MFSRTWLSRLFTDQKRSRRRRLRDVGRLAIRRLLSETLEDRRMLATLSISDAGSLDEGDTGTTAFDFMVSLSEAETQAVTVSIGTSDGTATVDDLDFVPLGAAFAEVNGIVRVEAENYTSRLACGCGNQFLNVPGENAGSPTAFANPIGSYLQNLPDGGEGATTNPRTEDRAHVDYKLLISTPGVYQLYVRWDGWDGASDSLHGMLMEQFDGVGGSIPDWYRFSHAGDSNFNTIPWQGVGEIEGTSADSNDVPAIWNIANPGIYTIRFVSREDGSALDSFVFQRTNLPAPTGNGPTESSLGGSLTFAPGETTKTVTVETLGDGKVEADETFFVNLERPTNATIADAQGVGTILNDDFIDINDVTVVEGTGGTTDAVFAVTLSESFASTVTVDYAAADGVGGGRATAPQDFLPSSGTLTFAPGETSKTITVPVVGDSTVEFDETFFVNLTSSTGAGIGDGQGLGTIQNDDGSFITWTGAGDGTSWNDATNWNENRVPGATDGLVFIPDVAGTSIINVVGNRTVQSLISEETIRAYGGRLTLTEGNSILDELQVGRAGGFSAGNLRINGDDVTVNTLTQITGTIDGSGDLIVETRYDWNAGAQAGTGDTTVNGSMAIQGAFALTLRQRTLVTNGTTTYSGSGSLGMGDGAVLRNTGTFMVQGNKPIDNLGGTGTVLNQGLFQKTSGTGRARISRNFTNSASGILDVQVGEVSLATFTNFSGSTLTGGTVRVNGTLSFTGADIKTSAATIELTGANSRILNDNFSDALANFDTIKAGGGLSLSGGRDFSGADDFSNAGNVTIGTGSTFAVAGDYTQTDGSTALQDGTLDPTGAVIIDGGVLAGTGTVAADVTNAGEVSPGTPEGVLNITGSYTQNAAGSMNFEMGAGSKSSQAKLVDPGFDQVNVTGPASLDGTLNVLSLGGAPPTSATSSKSCRLPRVLATSWSRM